MLEPICDTISSASFRHAKVKVLQPIAVNLVFIKSWIFLYLNGIRSILLFYEILHT